MIRRPDTLVQVIDPAQGLLGGYAQPRNCRDLHGSFVDDRSALSFVPYGKNPIIPAINLAVVQDDPGQLDLAGYVASWRTDDIGLYCEVQLIKSLHFADLWHMARAGRLYFCPRRLPCVCEWDAETGYLSKETFWAVSLTEYPGFRPNCWPDADSYLSYLDAHTALLFDMSSDNEATPLHQALPEGLLSYAELSELAD